MDTGALKSRSAGPPSFTLGRHIIVSPRSCVGWRARVTLVNHPREDRLHPTAVSVEHSGGRAGTSSSCELISAATRTAILWPTTTGTGWKAGLHGPSCLPTLLHLAAIGVVGSEPAQHCFLLSHALYFCFALCLDMMPSRLARRRSRRAGLAQGSRVPTESGARSSWIPIIVVLTLRWQLFTQPSLREGAGAKSAMPHPPHKPPPSLTRLITTAPPLGISRQTQASRSRALPPPAEWPSLQPPHPLCVPCRDVTGPLAPSGRM